MCVDDPLQGVGKHHLYFVHIREELKTNVKKILISEPELKELCLHFALFQNFQKIFKPFELAIMIITIHSVLDV